MFWNILTILSMAAFPSLPLGGWLARIVLRLSDVNINSMYIHEDYVPLSLEANGQGNPNLHRGREKSGTNSHDVARKQNPKLTNSPTLSF